MSTDTFDIQEIVTLSGIPRRTIYFYVQQGLLPPPQGAGLAAFYTEDHLLRLRAIPVLRRQGLRLDEIRERFEKMSSEELSRLLAAEGDSEEPQHTGLAYRLPSIEALVEAPVHGQRYLHYDFPAGITINAPESLNPSDRQRLALLLQAARQIFSSSGPVLIARKDEDQPDTNSPEDSHA